jgi:hypothetical protein
MDLQFLLSGQLQPTQESIELNEADYKSLIILAVAAIAIGAGLMQKRPDIQDKVVKSKQQITTLLSDPRGKQKALQYLQAVRSTAKNPAKIDMIIDEVQSLESPEDISTVLAAFNPEIIQSQQDPNF